MDLEADIQWPRDSISTFDSDLSRSSIAASSVFSHQSRASSCTNYSTASLGSAEAGYNHNYHPVVDPRQQQKTSRQQCLQPPARTLAEKQADNGYACSHCPNTFKKKADRKKHFQDRCTRLGDGNICPSCTHVGRNAHQVRLHRSRHGHPEPVQSIKLSQKRAFTCSDDGKIYYDAKAFFSHFDSLDCALNHYCGTHHHQARVITLLQEGRYAEHRHRNSTNLYAVLQNCCTANGMSDHGWKALIRSLPDEIALAYADRLEWGQCSDLASPLSRLGYTSKTKMVSEILNTAAEHYKATQTLQASSAKPSLSQSLLHEKPLPPFLPSTLDLGPDPALGDLANLEQNASRDIEHNDSGRHSAVHESTLDVHSHSSIQEHDLPLRSLGRTEDYSPAVAEVRRMLAPTVAKAGSRNYRNLDGNVDRSPDKMIHVPQTSKAGRSLVRRKRPPSLASEPHPNAVTRYAMHAYERSWAIAQTSDTAMMRPNQPGSSGSSKSYDDFFDFTKYCESQLSPNKTSSKDDVTALPSIDKSSPKSPSRARAFFQQLFASPHDTQAGDAYPTTAQADDPTTTAEVPYNEMLDHTRVKRHGGDWSHYNRNGNFF